MPEPLREYFPEIGHDLTLVTWEHAVNSKEKLEKALAGNGIQFPFLRKLIKLQF